MIETLMILASLAPAVVVPLAVLSKCSGAPFKADEEIFCAEILEYMQRSIAKVFYIPREMLEPPVHEWKPVRQLEYFSVVINFDMGDDK
jgi:hypothetical protein